MVSLNFTLNGDSKTLSRLEMFCSSELTEAKGIHSQLLSLSGLNIFLSITAFLGNSLIIFALQKESSLHPPSKLLFRNLAITDLCVGIIAEPLLATYLMSVVFERWNICHFTFVGHFMVGFVLGGVSLLTVTAISVDRLLALLLRLQYRPVVTLKRTYVTVIVFWVVSIVGTTLYFRNRLITLWYSCIIIALCLVSSIFCYTKIYLTLCRRRVQPSQASPLNIARYRKAVSSALWVQLILVVCYLPFCVMMALTTPVELSSSAYVRLQLTGTLINLNSSLNPVLYCWKIGEVRQAVKDTVKQLCCLSS